MNAWSAVQYVGTGLSLVAFAIAAALFAYRARLKQREDIIRSADPKDRLEAISTTAEFFRVDVSGLPAKKQQEIVLAQIHLRARRELLIAAGVLVVALLLAITAVVALLKPDRGISQNRLSHIEQCYRFDPQSGEQSKSLGTRTCFPGRVVFVKYWDPTDYTALTKQRDPTSSPSSWPIVRANRVFQARGLTVDGGHIEWVEQNLTGTTNRLETWGAENHYWVSVIENTGLGRGMTGFVLRRVDLQSIPLGRGKTQCDSTDNKRDVFEFAIPQDVSARISAGTKPTIGFRRVHVSCTQEVGFNPLPAGEFEDTGMPIVAGLSD